MTVPTREIRHYMTPTPHSIGIDQPLLQARALMRRLQIRHLPILDGGTLAGVISDRDVLFTETFKDLDAKRVPVEEAMSREVWSVPPSAALDTVVETMATHKYGCAVVMEGPRVIGIFTTTDVCRVLLTLLEQKAPSVQSTSA